MPRTLVLSALVTSVFSASPAWSQTVDQDMRCLILGTFFQGAAKDAATKQAASTSSLFYLGRVSARVAPGELKGRYLAQAKGIKLESAGPLMNACFQLMQAQGRSVDAVRKEIARSLPKKSTPSKK